MTCGSPPALAVASRPTRAARTNPTAHSGGFEAIPPGIHDLEILVRLLAQDVVAGCVYRLDLQVRQDRAQQGRPLRAEGALLLVAGLDHQRRRRDLLVSWREGAPASQVPRGGIQHAVGRAQQAASGSLGLL